MFFKKIHRELANKETKDVLEYLHSCSKGVLILFIFLYMSDKDYQDLKDKIRKRIT
tara:strand:- start:10243 stop:10410 length:168 start_codon:yes stop_codon:yes gene_type:complete